MKAVIVALCVGAGLVCGVRHGAAAEPAGGCETRIAIGNEGAAPEFALIAGAPFVFGSKRHRVVSGLAHLHLGGARIDRAIVALCESRGRTHWRAIMIEAAKTLEIQHVALGDPQGGEAYARFRVVLNPDDATWEAADSGPETLKVLP